MLKLAMCDDDADIIETLEKYMERFRDNGIEHDVYFSAQELYSYKKKMGLHYNAYILDIEMQGMDGLELAKKIREEEPNSLIVFLTSYSRYVFDVFEVVTFDFLLKPIEYDKFKGVIEKMKHYLHMTKKMFAFSYRKNSFSIPCDEILYIEKSGRKAFLYTKEGEYPFNMTLEEIWKQLDSDLFAAIHTSCIVNLAYIQEIVRNEVLLKNGEKLFASKSHCHEIKTKHLRFIKEKL